MLGLRQSQPGPTPPSHARQRRTRDGGHQLNPLLLMPIMRHRQTCAPQSAHAAEPCALPSRELWPS